MKLPHAGESTRNAIYIYGQRVTNLLFVLVSVPVITAHFGIELMGIWFLISQLSQHLVLLESGLGTSIVRFVARYVARNDFESASSFFSSAVLILFIFSLGLLVLSMPISNVFIDLYSIVGELSEDVWNTVVIALVSTGIGITVRSGRSVLAAHHQFATVAIVDSLVLVIRLILILMLFQMEEVTFFALGLVTFAPQLFGDLLLFYKSQKSYTRLVISPHRIYAFRLKKVLSVSLAASVISFSAILLRQSSPMLVGIALGPMEVALLTFPLLIVFAVMPFITIVVTLLSPVASSLSSLGRDVELYEIVMYACRYMIFVSSLIWISFFYLGEYLISLWLGDSNIDSRSVLAITNNTIVVFGGLVLSSAGFALREALVAVGWHWRVSIGEVLGAFLGLSLGYFLLKFFGLGPEGMAIGVAVAFILRGMIFSVILASKYFRVPPYKLVGSVFFKPVCIIGVSYLAAECLFSCFTFERVSLLNGFKVLSVASVASVLAWRYLILPEHRAMLVNRVYRH